MSRCFRVNVRDNVATMLEDGCGAVDVLGEKSGAINALEEIQAGHKLALEDLRSGEAVIKFGVPIGRATCDIRAGQWIHLHNCASNFDERSQTLDPTSAVPTDTRYE